MTNWYNYYYNEVIRDAEMYLDDHFEEFVIRDIDDHEITDYADTETIEDALFLSDEVCGNGDMGHPRIPEDLGDVIFSDLFRMYVRDFGEPDYERLTGVDGRVYLDAILRCFMLGECLATVYDIFENKVESDGRE